MVKTNIYLVRHAHSFYTPDEINRPLSDKGLLDAIRVTELLIKEKITHVFSSPFKRAIQTVEDVANIFDLNIVINDNFRDRKLADHSVDDFNKVIFEYWQDFNFSLEGGETSYVAQARGVKALQNILEHYSGGNIVIGTHGNMMVLIMNYFDQTYDYDIWRQLKMPDIYKLSFDEKKLMNVKPMWS